MQNPQLTSEQMSELGRSIKTDFKLMHQLASGLVAQAIQKDAAYGASWKARGGIGAYFTYVRKPDRLEAQLKKANYNAFDISIPAEAGESIDETLRDNINYCLLILTTREMMRQRLAVDGINSKEDADAGPTPGYVDQDRRVG
jgi:hypothetical protein